MLLISIAMKRSKATTWGARHLTSQTAPYTFIWQTLVREKGIGLQVLKRQSHWTWSHWPYLRRTGFNYNCSDCRRTFRGRYCTAHYDFTRGPCTFRGAVNRDILSCIRRHTWYGCRWMKLCYVIDMIQEYNLNKSKFGQRACGSHYVDLQWIIGGRN